MSKTKKIFGIFLIIFASSFVIILGFLNQFLGNSSGEVKLEKKIEIRDLDFINKNNKYSLVYFGYVGCQTICVPSMQELNNLHKLLKKYSIDDINIYFLNVKPSIDKDTVDVFAKSFNSEFIGVYLDEERLKYIASLFGFRYSNVLVNNFEVEHTGYIYLLEKKDNIYFLNKMYTNRPFDIENIAKDLLKLKK
jgi:protein SCO1/2